MFFNDAFIKGVAAISLRSLSDDLVESISEYYIIISVDISRTADKDFMKLTINFALICARDVVSDKFY